MRFLTSPIPRGLPKTKQSEKTPIWRKARTPGVEKPVAGAAFEVVLGLKGVRVPVGGCGHWGRADHGILQRQNKQVLTSLETGSLGEFLKGRFQDSSFIQVTTKTLPVLGTPAPRVTTQPVPSVPEDSTWRLSWSPKNPRPTAAPGQT